MAFVFECCLLETIVLKQSTTLETEEDSKIANLSVDCQLCVCVCTYTCYTGPNELQSHHEMKSLNPHYLSIQRSRAGLVILLSPFTPW